MANWQDIGAPPRISLNFDQRDLVIVGGPGRHRVYQANQRIQIRDNNHANARQFIIPYLIQGAYGPDQVAVEAFEGMKYLRIRNCAFTSMDRQWLANWTAAQPVTHPRAATPQTDLPDA